MVLYDVGLCSDDVRVISATCSGHEGSGTRHEDKAFALGCDWLSRA